MTKIGPNDDVRLVWALGTCFLLCLRFFYMSNNDSYFYLSHYVLKHPKSYALELPTPPHHHRFQHHHHPYHHHSTSYHHPQRVKMTRWGLSHPLPPATPATSTPNESLRLVGALSPPP